MSLFRIVTKKPRPIPTRDVAQQTDTQIPRHGATLPSATAQAILQRQARRDRRRATRYPCQLQTACVVISLVEPLLLSVKVRDISQTGIGLVAATRIQPGAFLAVKLQGPKHPTPRILRAQVMHSTVQKDRRTWVAGCSFVGELGKDELALLI